MDLVDFLSRASPARERVWDCGCGSGQLSVLLASPFRHVVATDASRAQLARGRGHPRVAYACALAEASPLSAAAVDLVTASQAAHWFDLDGFYAEVGRIARPGALVALVSYAMMRVNDVVDAVVDRFQAEVLGEHWPAARRHVEEGYRSLPFPFREIDPPRLEIREEWRLRDVVGYVETWSAVGRLERSEGRASLDSFFDELRDSWGAPDVLRPVRWPLSLRAGYVGR